MFTVYEFSIFGATDFNKNINAASFYHPFGETDLEEGFEHYLYYEKEKNSTHINGVI
jgi:hypothetical protein